MLQRLRRPAALLAFSLTAGAVGCAKGPAVVGATTEAPPAAPITAGLAGELLSPQSEHKHTNAQEAVFVRTEPAHCGGVAVEVDPPFLMHDPVAVNTGSWVSGQGSGRGANIEEIVAVYHADFDPERVIAAAAKTVEACADTPFTIYQRHQRTGAFQLLPRKDSGSPDITLWSFAARERNWACDNALIAAHNAAVEITACAPRSGFDVLSLAQEALARIKKLAKPLD